MSTQKKHSNEHQSVPGEGPGEYASPTNIIIENRIYTVNTGENGSGTIGDKNVIEARKTNTEIERNNSGLWSLIAKIRMALKR